MNIEEILRRDAPTVIDEELRRELNEVNRLENEIRRTDAEAAAAAAAAHDPFLAGFDVEGKDAAAEDPSDVNIEEQSRAHDERMQKLQREKLMSEERVQKLETQRQRLIERQIEIEKEVAKREEID